MGLRDALAQLAARRASVLLIEAVDGWRIRVEAEQVVAALGWRTSLSPADADVLAVCGTPGPELAGAVERIWLQLPGPRVRILIGSPACALQRLKEAHHQLLAVGAHVHDAGTRSRTPDERTEPATQAAGHGSGAAREHGGMAAMHGQASSGAMGAAASNVSETDQHETSPETAMEDPHRPGKTVPREDPDPLKDHASMHHSTAADRDKDAELAPADETDDAAPSHVPTGHHVAAAGGMLHTESSTETPAPAHVERQDVHHGGMDHGGMDMAPGGIPLAGGAEDRDGLEMDTLTVQLGPVLPFWPPGLVVRCSLNGDVLTRAEARWLDRAALNVPDPGGGEAAARRYDDVAALLALAGASDLATEARMLRDSLLRDDGALDGGALDRLERRIRRSRLLRWSLGRLGVVDDPVLLHHLGAQQGGSVFDRLLAMVGATRSALRGSAPESSDAARLIAAVPQLVTGLDLAAARLVVASLGIPSARVAAGVDHG